MLRESWTVGTMHATMLRPHRDGPWAGPVDSFKPRFASINVSHAVRRCWEDASHRVSTNGGA